MNLEEARLIRRVSAGIREEEICQILNLKKNLDYHDVLIQYATSYLRMGWDLLAVNFKGEPALDLDFGQSQKLWAEMLTGLGLEGIQVNLGVRTGAPSRLLVLEVHREESRSPFDQRGEWCSGCVAEVGLEREQHYYTLPKGWQPPASFFMESCQIMVFGEGGVVLAPPSLEPRAQLNLRWLRPPWESPPTRPSPGLCKFIKEHAPVLPQAPLKPEPVMIPWTEIYPAVRAHPEVLQALLAPASSSERYYQHLLKTAQGVGLDDPQVLLGLLWHAPLGNSHNHPQRAEYLAALVKRVLAGVEEGPGWKLEPDSREGTTLARSEEPTEGERLMRRVRNEARSVPPQSPHFGSFAPPPASPLVTERLEPVVGQPTSGIGLSQPAWAEVYEALSEVCRFSHENLVVERRRYEAMIYELGKLGALHDHFKRENRQNKALRTKLESQWTKELDCLRQLVGKKTKKGWYRSWRQD